MMAATLAHVAAQIANGPAVAVRSIAYVHFHDQGRPLFLQVTTVALNAASFFLSAALIAI